MAVRLDIDKNRNKLAFLEHGLGARKEYPHMLVLEEFFVKNGYNVVNLDATNSLNASESSTDGITFTSHYDDLKDVVEWAKTQNFYKEPFALAGQSLGAAACVKYAGQYPTKVNILLFAACPFIKGSDLVNQDEMMMYIEEHGYLDKISKSTGRTLHINKIFNDDVKTYDLSYEIKNITAKTFVLQGLLDAEYIIKNNKKIYEMLNCPKQIFLLENVPHDLANTPETKTIFERALEKIFSEVSSFKYYFEQYYETLKNMYVDEIVFHKDFKMVKSNIIDDGIWNFIYDIKANNYNELINAFNQSKEFFKNRTPRLYILKSDKNEKYIDKLKDNYKIYCEDSWFNTPLNELNLNYKAKIDVVIVISNNKQEIIDCVMEGFSTNDPNDPYGDLSPTYRESLDKKLFTEQQNCKTINYVAKYRDKVVSMATITIKNNTAFLNNVTTLKEYKCKAISKEILSFIIKDLKNIKIQNIVFATETGAYTETYYKNLGFKVVDHGYCFEETKIKT